MAQDRQDHRQRLRKPLQHPRVWTSRRSAAVWTEQPDTRHSPGNPPGWTEEAAEEKGDFWSPQQSSSSEPSVCTWLRLLRGAPGTPRKVSPEPALDRRGGPEANESGQAWRWPEAPPTPQVWGNRLRVYPPPSSGQRLPSSQHRVEQKERYLIPR